jgi:hypothetical protein
MKITIEDPLTSKKTKYGQGLKEEFSSDIDINKIEIYRAAIRLRRVTTDGRLVLRVIAAKHPEEIIKLIDENTF